MPKPAKDAKPSGPVRGVQGLLYCRLYGRGMKRESNNREDPGHPGQPRHRIIMRGLELALQRSRAPPSFSRLILKARLVPWRSRARRSKAVEK
jgi:hypothetical protein